MGNASLSDERRHALTRQIEDRSRMAKADIRKAEMTDWRV
jgi:hypothetical protein